MKKILKISTLLFALMLIVSSCGRSISKELLGDLTGACADAKKAINLGSNSSVKWVASNCN